MSPVQQASFAFAGQYSELRGEKQIQTPFGLGKKALEVLQAIPKGGLKEEEKPKFLEIYLDLMFRMGDVDQIAEELQKDDFRKALGPFMLSQFQLFVGGIRGDYQTADEGAAGVEKHYREVAAFYRTCIDQSFFFCPSMSSGASQATAYAFRVNTDIGFVESTGVHNDLFNIMTLRGILALESGDTAKARAIFEEIHTAAGDTVFFTERTIADRYRALLNQQPR